jgi:crooked neck
MYTSFEKKHGDRENVEEVILCKRRYQYEDELALNPRNYDVWFDYIHLEEQKKDHEKIREVRLEYFLSC